MIPFFAGVDKVKFRRQVVPGDQLRLELSVLKQRAGTCRLQGKAYVADELAAEAEVFAVIRPVGEDESGGRGIEMPDSATVSKPISTASFYPSAQTPECAGDRSKCRFRLGDSADPFHPT